MSTESSILGEVQVPIVGALDSDVGLVVNYENAGYKGGAPQLHRIAARVLTTGEMIPWPSPCGSNCSYTISFTGPAWHCIQMDTSQPHPNLGTPPVTTGPYWAADSFMSGIQGNFPNPQDHGLWIVYGLLPINYTIHCGLYMATYTTFVSYSNGLRQVTSSVARTEHIDDSAKDVDLLTLDASVDNRRIWTLLNLYSIHNAAARHLIGNIQFTLKDGLLYHDTLIRLSSFVKVLTRNITFPENFCATLEQYMINTTLSLIDFLQSPPTPQIDGSPISMPAVYTTAVAVIYTLPPRYSYSRSVLWISYSAAIACTAICVAFGYWMFSRNGGHKEMSFAEILSAMREGSLDVAESPSREKTDRGMLRREATASGQTTS